MKQEIMNEIKQAMEQAQKWVHDPKTNLLYVEVEPLYWRAIYPPEEMSTSIPAACVLLQHAPALLDEIERLQAELKRWTGVFTGVTPEDMRRRMMDMSVAHAWLSEENFRLTAYVAELEEKLETTRMQLAACDVVANSNTPESAQEHRQMSSRYKSAALLSVESAVDREMELRQRVAELEPASATTQPITPPTPGPSAPAASARGGRTNTPAHITPRVGTCGNSPRATLQTTTRAIVRTAAGKLWNSPRRARRRPTNEPQPRRELWQLPILKIRYA